ncbi:DNA gyrase subunit B [Fodinisporobacter ferrooxydans]|uniref:DNA topoisomerase (ATP-hydrolyzing) n=1 Tax=Fodinisporobacter ferrooxydans TaxID=2901836 RepID=A0ABY4CJ62_9BACL|nr:DNA gyrase subunit B [Alicyclobacillaceae bacterium MYW30-H2]
MSQEYSGDSIVVLEGLEAVRVRPGMYVGSTNAKGLHHCVWEIIDNAVDEHLAGFCTRIDVRLNKDGSLTVQDNGRGVPVEMNAKMGMSAARIVYTVLHAGGKFNNINYKTAGGLHGVGASVVNALSKWMNVEIHRGGKIYRDRFENGGHPVVELKKGLLPAVGKTDQTGTTVTFMPDDAIFETVEFKPDIIKKRMKELAYLNKGLVLGFTEEASGETVQFYEKDGIAGFIRELNKTKDVLHKDVVYLTGESSDIGVEIAFQYTNEYTESILSFCNNINTIEGGYHVSGFKTALTRILNQYARELGVLKEKDDNFDGKDVRNGIAAIVLVKHPNPQYEGQTKTKLNNSDVRGAVDEIVATEGPLFFDRNLEILKTILDNAVKSLKLRKVEEKAREGFLAKASTMTSNGKLAACQSRKPEECELYIVEGDSAGGTAKLARDRKTQAILPIKGKIMNVEKSTLAKIIENVEVASLITALGCGFGEGLGDDFDIRKAKYHKIVILTDADVDGSHIRTLLLTFFYRYMPELIYEGYIYIGMPPLYMVTSGKDVSYLYDDRELEAYRKKIGQKKFALQRYKGLGEMNPDQLWETTLNSKTRLLKQVCIEDAVQADDITNILMGSKVPPRREFITQNAKYANIDL